MTIKRKATPKDNQFRRTQQKVDAFRWDGLQFNYPLILDFIGGLKNGRAELDLETGEIDFILYSPDGPLVARPGDWIVREPKGQCHPVKPFLFDAQYANVYRSGKEDADNE